MPSTVLPASGDISIAMLCTALGFTASSKLSFGDAVARQIAGIPSGQIRASDFHGKSVSVVSTQVYIGVSPETLATADMLLTLSVYAVVSLPYQFSLNAGPGEYMYWAAPTSMGYVKFYDPDSMFTGGWDGAHNDWFVPGPSQVIINSVPHYVYRSDFPNLGPMIWEARVETNPYY